MEERFRVGIISSVHGVHGECKVYPTTDDIGRYKKLKKVYACDNKGNSRLLNVEGVKFFKNMAIVKFAGCDTPEEIQKMRGWDLMVDREDAVPLAKDEYYIADLIGLRAIDDEGSEIGKIEEIFPTGANLVVQIKTDDGQDVLVPYVRDVFIKEVDLDAGTMTIHLIDGMR